MDIHIHQQEQADNVTIRIDTREERIKLPEKSRSFSFSFPMYISVELLADDFEEKVNGATSRGPREGSLYFTEDPYEFNLSKVTRQMYRCTPVYIPAIPRRLFPQESRVN